MRKFLAFSIIMMGLLGMQAQNSILNSDFELWSYGKPVNWTLTGVMTIPLEVHFGEQTSDAHTGNSAIKVASADATSSVISYTMNLPGFLQAGESEGFSVPFEDALVAFGSRSVEVDTDLVVLVRIFRSEEIEGIIHQFSVLLGHNEQGHLVSLLGLVFHPCRN